MLGAPPSVIVRYLALAILLACGLGTQVPAVLATIRPQPLPQVVPIVPSANSGPTGEEIMEIMEASLPAAIVEADAPPSQVEHAAEERKGRLAGRRICLDPGHDREYVPGAVAYDSQRRVLFQEQDLTHAVALRVKTILEDEGAEVCITRDEAGVLQIRPYDFNGNGSVRRAEDAAELSQPRVDYMSQFGAELILSLHFNGFGDPSVSGTEVYYSDTGVHEAENRKLAGSVQENLLNALQSSGYPTVDRGIRSDRYKVEYMGYVAAYGLARSCNDCQRLFVLGNNPMLQRKGTWSAGALVEILFLSNERDVRFLQRPDALDVAAHGITEGIMAYFADDAGRQP